MDELQRMKSDLQGVKSDMSDVIDEINSLLNYVDNKTASNNSIGHKPTQNEIGSMEHPASDFQNRQSEIKTIRLNNNVLINIGNKVSSIEDSVSRLKDTTEGINPDAVDHSIKLEKIVNRCYGLYDELRCTLLDDNKWSENNRSIYNFFYTIKNIKYKNGEIVNNGSEPYIQKKNKDDFEENIDEIIQMLTSYSSNISNIIDIIDNTTFDEIQDEINEARQERMKQEMEEMQPYMDLNTIEGICKSNNLWGRVSVSKLADMLTEDSKRITYEEDSVREMLDNIDEITPIGSGVNVEKINDRTYKITRND